ncbi:MAG: YceI family protein [Terricaulis sp.]
MRIALIAAALALAACNPQPQPEAAQGPPTPVAIDAPSGEYALDPTHSSILVRANHFGLSHYTLRLTGLSGQLNFNAEDPAKSTVTARVAADTVQTEHVGQSNFDRELENSQWLDAATHPSLTFASTRIELTSPNTGRMTGNLSIRGITHPVTFEVTFNQAYRQHPMGMPIALLGFSARGTIMRSEYGMTARLPLATGGGGVSDEVEILIETEFTRPAAPASPTN